MKICITGANGFIGKQLVKELIKSGHSIRVIIRKNEMFFPNNVEIIVGDLTKQDCQIKEFLKDCDVLINCAGEILKEELMESLHVEATKKLIQGAFEVYTSTGKRIHWVQLSSCGAYGPPSGRTEILRVVTENSPTNPNNEYERTKTAADQLIIDTSKERFLSYSILRPSNVIGPGMRDTSLLKFANMIRKKRFFFLGNPGAVTTYVHVNDVSRALILLAEDDRAKGKIYNLSSDCTIETLIKYIAEKLCLSIPTLRLPSLLIRTPLLILSSLLKNKIHIPKLDALVIRTRYPSVKIESELDFVFINSMPNGLEKLIDDGII